ncbi:MAG: branched-chain amino acid ABC transporter permease [Acetobacter aceti]|uniref:Branched-chain amino acid ABC transporter permease n=1 Tax=Acetobacter aceti TaxID=435 RepID=A0A1U9KDM7_ACEAC|nr:branched-chain amino acid ABC transporter permease [Acetobacter aceti]AQS83839.1 hypothetical protein A0U92_02560 [Acetobacter aceti]
MNAYLSGLLVLYALNLISTLSAFLSLSGGSLNLAIAGYMALGAYITAWLVNSYPVPPFLVMTGGMAACCVLAFVFENLVRSLKGLYYSLASFALSQIVPAVFMNIESLGGAAGYPVAAFIPPWYTWACAGAALACILYLSFTYAALYLNAISHDTLVPALMGIPARPIILSSALISAAFAGLGGGLYALSFGFVEAQHFTIMLSIYAVLTALVGGTQTPWGAPAGAAVLTFAPELFRVSDQWRYVIFAFILLACLYLRPAGLLTSDLFRRKRPERTESERLS